MLLILPQHNFTYIRKASTSKLFSVNTFLTSIQKVITGTGPGYKNFITLRGRKCHLDIKSKFVQTKITQPFFIKQRVYSHFKLSTSLRLLNKGRTRLEQRMPVIKIKSKSYNLIKQ
jgi:hypothetical protein